MKIMTQWSLLMAEMKLCVKQKIAIINHLLILILVSCQWIENSIKAYLIRVLWIWTSLIIFRMVRIVIHRLVIQVVRKVLSEILRQVANFWIKWRLKCNKIGLIELIINQINNSLIVRINQLKDPLKQICLIEH